MNNNGTNEKPREWWIGFWDWKQKEAHNLTGQDVASVKYESTWDTPLHVIEHSAYQSVCAKLEAMKKQADELAKALDFYTWDGFVNDDNGDAADKALAEYREFLEKLK